MKYKKILLKLSGEALKGKEGIIDSQVIFNLAKQIAEVHALGVEIGIVVGGGNIWRGKIASELGMDRSTADYMGMLATVMNGLAICDGLEKYGVDARVMSSIDMRKVAEPYIRRRALKHLANNRVVIFVSGTGSPYFSTDTTASLRAAEIGSDIIFMAKNFVDGVYDADPKIVTDAKKFDVLSYDEIVQKDLQVMDLTAITMCKENDLPILVFNINKEGNIMEAVTGSLVGTLINQEGRR